LISEFVVVPTWKKKHCAYFGISWNYQGPNSAAALSIAEIVFIYDKLLAVAVVL